MKIAIIENDTVVNLVEGDLEKLASLFEQVVAETEETGNAHVGLRYNGEKFEQPIPHNGWIWNEELFQYEPPMPKPDGTYIWNDKTENWIELEKPYESWIWNEELTVYTAPKPLPTDGRGYKWDEKSLEWVVVE